MALTAVMSLNGIEPDFPPRGTLALKPWMVNDQGLALPSRIALPTVEAPKIAVRKIASPQPRTQLGSATCADT